MSRKKVTGRAALSFAVRDGVLDTEQILRTEPWNQIDDFVQRNFLQNVLNEFNDRLMLDPRLVPSSSKPSAKKKEVTSSGAIRKRQGQRVQGKSKEGEEGKNPGRVKGGKKRGEGKEESLKVMETGKKEDSKNDKNKENDKPKKDKPKNKRQLESSKQGKNAKEKMKDIKKRQTGEQMIENASNEPSYFQGNENQTNHPSTDEMKPVVSIKKEIEDETNNTEISGELATEIKESDLKMSTPKREILRTSNSSAKEQAAVASKCDTIFPKKETSLQEKSKTKKQPGKGEKRMAKDLNNNCSKKRKETIPKQSLKEKSKTKDKKKSESKDSKRSLSSKCQQEMASLKCRKRDGKTGTTEKSGKVGTFEQQLIDKRKRRDERRLRRRERKVERAINTFSHHVMSIMKIEGFSPDCLNVDDDEDSYSDSSESESSYTESCCSDSQCSCCTTCSSFSSEYTEYSSSSD